MLSSGIQVWSWQPVDCFASLHTLPEVTYNARSWSLNLRWCLLLLIQAPRKSQSTAVKQPPVPGPMPHTPCYDEEGLMMAWITLGWQLPPPRLGLLSHKVKPGGNIFHDEPETISGNETPGLRSRPLDSRRMACCSSMLSSIAPN